MLLGYRPLRQRFYSLLPYVVDCCVIQCYGSPLSDCDSTASLPGKLLCSHLLPLLRIVGKVVTTISWHASPYSELLCDSALAVC